ncbi:hypothetical protein PNH38_18635, partial [Anoxybacillus rupiensis]
KNAFVLFGFERTFLSTSFVLRLRLQASSEKLNFSAHGSREVNSWQSPCSVLREYLSFGFKCENMGL